jgi:hypothetical protein
MERTLIKTIHEALPPHTPGFPMELQLALDLSHDREPPECESP